MKVTLEVHEDKMDLLQQLAEEYKLDQPDEDVVIPEWQKELVRKRLAETRPEDYIPWREARKRLGLA